FQAEDGIRDFHVTGVQTCALPICGRVPVGEVLVDHGVDAAGVHRVRDVEQDPVAGAGAGGEPDLRVDGDVVALVRLGAGLGARAVIPAGPEAGDVAGLIREDARLADDARQVRGGEGDLDHLDAEVRDVRVLGRAQGRAALQLGAGAGDARAGHVDVDVVRVVRHGHEGVGVGAAAGLYGGQLLRHAQVRDAVDPDAAGPLGADRVLHALGAAVHAAAGILHGTEEQVPVGRRVALAAGAHEARAEPR